MRRAEKEDKSPDVIGPQRYLQFPQNFGGFLNPPAEFLQREKELIFIRLLAKQPVSQHNRTLHPHNMLKKPIHKFIKGIHKIYKINESFKQGIAHSGACC